MRGRSRRGINPLLHHAGPRGRRADRRPVHQVLRHHAAETGASRHEIYDEDAVLEYPQSGERIRGRRNIQAARFAQPDRKRFDVRRILGGHGLWISEVTLTDDEQPVPVVSLMECEGDKVLRETQYFGEPVAPGPSRARRVERIE